MSDNTQGFREESASHLKNHLLGCLEAALFMPACAERFSSCTKAMKKSFLIPLMILPLTLITVLFAHPHTDITGNTQTILMAVYSLRLFIYLGVFLSIVFFLAKTMDRLESFNRFVTANNWLSLPAALISLPLLIAFMNGHYVWADIYPLMVCITLYSYIYTAFMATHVLRIPFEFACFIMVIGMAVHQSSLDVLKWAAVNAAYLVAG